MYRSKIINKAFYKEEKQQHLTLFIPEQALFVNGPSAAYYNCISHSSRPSTEQYPDVQNRKCS